MRTLYAAFLSLSLIGSISAAHAARGLADQGLVRLVSGDGLDRDAAASGNDRTGGMWENATGATGAGAFQGRWAYYPRRSYHHHHADHRRWW